MSVQVGFEVPSHLQEISYPVDPADFLTYSIGSLMIGALIFFYFITDKLRQGRNSHVAKDLLIAAVSSVFIGTGVFFFLLFSDNRI